MILVDDRVGSAEIRPHLCRPSILCHLDFADFAMAGNGPDGAVNIGIERKGISDLLTSMSSGRLSGHQLIGLKDNYDFCYLLVEGIWRADKRSGVLVHPRGKGWVPISHGSRRYMAREVWSFLNTISVMCGVVVVQTSNQWETAKWLDALFGWWNKKWEKHKSHLQFVKPQTFASLSKPNLVTRMANQFDGIGWDKARKIGELLTLDDLMEATPKGLQRVEGIGPKLAQSIIDQREEAK